MEHQILEQSMAKRRKLSDNSRDILDLATELPDDLMLPSSGLAQDTQSTSFVHQQNDNVYLSTSHSNFVNSSMATNIKCTPTTFSTLPNSLIHQQIKGLEPNMQYTASDNTPPLNTVNPYIRNVSAMRVSNVSTPMSNEDIHSKNSQMINGLPNGAINSVVINGWPARHINMRTSQSTPNLSAMSVNGSNLPNVQTSVQPYLMQISKQISGSASQYSSNSLNSVTLTSVTYSQPIANTNTTSSLDPAPTATNNLTMNKTMDVALSSSLGGVQSSAPISSSVIPGVKQNAVNEASKRKFQNQLTLLLHAHKCQQRGLSINGEVTPCAVPNCKTMKAILAHMTTCTAGKTCKISHCASSRQIIQHWSTCIKNNCPICQPVRNAQSRRIAASNSFPSSIVSTDTAGDLSTSIIHNDSAAPSAGPPPTYSDAIGQSQGSALHIRMATPSISTVSPLHSINSPVSSATIRTQGDGPVRPNVPRFVKPWQQNVTYSFREHLVHKLVNAIVPTTDPEALKDPRRNNIVNSARKLENGMFETADSREDYYQLLAEKIYKITKDLEEKRAQRVKSQDAVAVSENVISNSVSPYIASTTSGSSSTLTVPVLNASFTKESDGITFSDPGTFKTSVCTISSNSNSSVKTFPSPYMSGQESVSNYQNISSAPYTNETIDKVSAGAPSSTTDPANYQAVANPIHSLGKAGQFQTGGKPEAMATEVSIKESADGPASGNDANRSTDDINSNSDTLSVVKTEIISFDDIKNETGADMEPAADVKTDAAADVKLECGLHESVNSESSQDNKTLLSSNDDDLSKPGTKKVFKPEELRKALLPSLEKIYKQDPEGVPFRNPVDPIGLQIPDYYDIVKNPIDLSTIKRKLDTGQYPDPWAYCDDVWMMFDNAWLYNRKTSKVYKFCSKLAEIFEGEIDKVMQSMGYCCGRKYIFTPQILSCMGQQLCNIPRDAIYYSYECGNKQLGMLSEKYIYCEKCFESIQDEEIELSDQPGQSSLKVKKSNFVRSKNDHIDLETFVYCADCGRKWHSVCAVYHDFVYKSEFVCDNCLLAKNQKRKENKYSAKKLPNTKLGHYLENRVNNFLKKKDSEAGEVTIRVLSSTDKLCDVKPGIKSQFPDDIPDTYPYRSKAMFAFEDIDGFDVCFFGMHVQEYGSDTPHPNTRRVYISYLDSVRYFHPSHLRTSVYHEILIGYLDYVKKLGYATAHIWACPPCEGDDYIFHCHPPEQKIPKPKRLQEWYRKMLDKAVIERVVAEYKDILKYSMESNMTSAKDIPYFEGDFWPNIIEESIKELDEEEQKRKIEEAEAICEDTFDDIVPETEVYSSMPSQKKGQKSSRNKKANKSKSGQRKSQKKGSGYPYGCNDLTSKLFSTMEKHKEVFFVVHLHPDSAVANLPPIVDPDPLVSCDLMDGRDAFLTLSREKHYEFSSYRRVRYSTMALLYELHTQSRDGFVYTCNNCQAQVETRYHCTKCDDYDLCLPCYAKVSHEHKMEKLGLGFDDGSSIADNKSSQESRQISIQRCIQALLHTCQCLDANCPRMPSCRKMKRVVEHSRTCRKKLTYNCQICRQLVALSYHHAKQCSDARCLVPFCPKIKTKIIQREAQQRLAQSQLLSRRVAAMQQRPGLSQQSPASRPGSASGMSPSPAYSAGQQMSGYHLTSLQQNNYSQNGIGLQSQVHDYTPAVSGQTQYMGQQTIAPDKLASYNTMNQSEQMSFEQFQVNSQFNNMPFTAGQPGVTRGMVNQSGVPTMPQGSQRPMGHSTSNVLQQMIQSWKVNTPAQQQQLMVSFLKSNPQYLAAFLQQRARQQQGMQRQPNGQQPVRNQALMMQAGGSNQQMYPIRQSGPMTSQAMQMLNQSVGQHMGQHVPLNSQQMQNIVQPMQPVGQQMQPVGQQMHVIGQPMQAVSQSMQMVGQQMQSLNQPLHAINRPMQPSEQQMLLRLKMRQQRPTGQRAMVASMQPQSQMIYRNQPDGSSSEFLDPSLQQQMMSVRPQTMQYMQQHQQMQLPGNQLGNMQSVIPSQRLPIQQQVNDNFPQSVLSPTAQLPSMPQLTTSMASSWQHSGSGVGMHMSRISPHPGGSYGQSFDPSGSLVSDPISFAHQHQTSTDISGHMQFPGQNDLGISHQMVDPTKQLTLQDQLSRLTNS